MCLQEHFLLDNKDRMFNNTDKLRQAFDNVCDMFIVPAVKDKTQISRGRAKGGLAILWKKHLTKYVTKVPTCNPRIQAVLFTVSSSPILLINTYFPCDPRMDCIDIDELINSLSDIENIIRNTGPINILLAGDLNCQFDRRTMFTITIEKQKST